MGKRRPSGDGMVRKREDGRWEGRIVVGHKENGDSIFRYIYADTQKELTAKLRQNIEAFQGVELTEQSKMTLAQWLDEWLEKHMTGAVRPDTLAGYRRDLDNHVKPYLGEKSLLKITADDLQELYQLLLERGRKLPRQNCVPGLAPATVRGIHTTFHHALKAAADEGLIPFNPAEKVTPPSVPNTPKRVLTHDQLEKFLCAIRFDPIWHDFFYTELTTGLRRGELCGLTWDDFDSEAGTLKVRRTIHARKGGGLEAGETKTYAGQRTILLPYSTVQLLRERKRSALTQWIFPDPLRPERPVNPGSAYRRLKELLKQAELPSLRFHDLRHTFATSALEHGMDVKTLSTVIGHVSSATTLNVYAHVTDEMRQKAADKIDRAITGREPPQGKAPKPPGRTAFQPVKGKYRKPGTGCISQINDHLWEGRYSPKVNGKRVARNVYARTEAECEAKLAELIREMKAEIAAGKEREKRTALAG